MRRLVLRSLRPYTYHQQQLDERILQALERQSERLDRLEELARELVFTAEALRVANADRVARVAGDLRHLAGELQAAPYVYGDRFEELSSPVGPALGFQRSTSPARRQDTGYAQFEDVFRGPSKRVLDSQLPYLELLRTSQPVLDVGCGRGELLTLLREQGVAARGVDGDEEMVARCTALGLDVVADDANHHLEALDDQTLGTIFSAQVIEHLPYAQLQRLLDLALAKLRPGGILIAETVNPHRIASLKNFWVDPTHQHPIFPEVALALCGIAGFESAYVFCPGFASYEQARLSSPSYAVVARAPAPERDGA